MLEYDEKVHILLRPFEWHPIHDISNHTLEKFVVHAPTFDDQTSQIEETDRPFRQGLFQKSRSQTFRSERFQKITVVRELQVSLCEKTYFPFGGEDS